MEAIPQCSSGLDDETCNVKCFMMEDRGYLVSHPSLLRDADNHQQQHITHLESLVANDLLNHKVREIITIALFTKYRSAFQTTMECIILCLP